MKRKILLAFCLLTSIAAASVIPVSVTPSSGTGLAKQFVIAYTSTIGQSDFNGLGVSFSPSAPSLQRGPCQVWVGSTTGQIQLYLDNGYTVTGQQGSTGTLTNGHCTINLPTSTQWYSGGTQASFTVDVTFASNFGPINIYGRSLDSHMVDSDWIQLGTWTAAAGTNSATFVNTDTTTQGTWKTSYGADGHAVNYDVVAYPTYAQVTTDGTGFTWASSTADVRATQKYSASDRIASGWYSSTNETFDVNLTDGARHQVALYCLDWDGAAYGGRAERIDVIDGTSGAVIDTRTISSFENGEYLVWNVTGHVKIKITVTAGANAVVSGLFFGAAGAQGPAATYVTTDTISQGTWKSVYGVDGEAINGDSSAYPNYAQVAINGGSPFVWSQSTTDIRGTQKAASGSQDRIASGWYSWSAMSIDVNLTDSASHSVALYCLDWDGGARSQRIDVLDASTNMILDTRTISGFQNGQYLVWTLAGHIKLNVTLLGGSNAVVNGIFLGPPGIPNMTTTANATGTYQDMGTDEIGNDNFTGASVPLPSQIHPAPYLGLMTPSNNRLVHPGDHFTITISNVKPNSQVWIAETAASDPGIAQGAYTSSGYVGMTDNSGHFIWQSMVSNWLTSHVYKVWVGYWGGSATGPRPDTDIVGIVPIFAQDASGNPAAPAGLADLINQ